MAPESCSSLIGKLESSDYTNLRQDISEYLKPFSDFITFDFDLEKNSKKKKQKKKKTDIVTDPKLIRPLAKQFLPLISPALKLLPNRITELQKSTGGKEEETALELFDVYKLCLECLSCISPCLECKSFHIHFQRIRLVHCYEVWGWYVDAEIEGFSILESLRSVSLLKKKKIEGKFVPDLVGENDPELASLVVEVVLSLIKCSFRSKRKEDAVYQRVLALVDQVRPWLRVLESNVLERLHRTLVHSLYECTLFMLGEDEYFDGDLVYIFCMTTLNEYSTSSRKDQFLKVTRNICWALSSQWISRSSLILDIFKCLIEFITHDCKVGMEDHVNECFDIIHYCIRKCRLANTDLCRDVGRRLENVVSGFIKVLIPIDSILRLYSAGLHLMENKRLPSCIESESSLADFMITLSVHSGDLLYLADALHSLASYFHEGSLRCKSEHGRASFMSYLNALAFFCHPPAELVNKGSKLILTNFATVSSSIIYVLDALHQFCDAFLIRFSCAFERDREKFKESQHILLYVANAALIVSLRMDKNVEKSVHHIDCIMSSWWVQLKEMNFLIASLYNIGADLYNAQQVKQASVVFELCCRSAWTRVSFVCGKYIDKSEVIHDDWSEKAITDFVSEACSKSATLLEVLHQCGNSNLHPIMVSTLVNWSMAANLFENLDGLKILVRKWAKITCKDYKDADAVDGVPLLYSMLSGSSTPFNKRMTGIILEQELLGYEEMEAHNKNLCQELQQKIIDILLRKVYYVTKDYILQKSMALIKQGRIYRAGGISGLKNCIQCLSEAISTLIDVSSESAANNCIFSHQLALAYCLRALCTQEAQLDSDTVFPEGPSLEKEIMDDIHCALKLWSNFDWSVDVRYEWVTGNVIELLCCIADLLSAKGFFHLQYDIYKLIFMLLKRESVPLEKCFAMLWADRRLIHALCTTPDEDVVSSFAQQFGVRSDTVGFWINCIKDSHPLLVGFRQKLSLYDFILPQGGHCLPGGPLGCNVTIDQVKEVVSTISSNVNKTNSSFLVGHLYYDLSERLISSGQLIKALSFAREALQLRTKLLQKKFMCTFGRHHQNTHRTGETSRENDCDHAQFVVSGSVATAVWPHISLWNLEQHNLSQWNVLQCYLESILQMGTIHEALGNASMAEALLMQGKRYSSMGRLPIFQVAFASALGEIYCKKQLWDMAENELKSAKQILVDSSTTISCKRCKLTLDVTIDHRLGDLIRNCSDESRRNSLLNSFSAALDLYNSAMDKLNHFEQEISFSFSEERNQLCNKAHCSQKAENEGSHLNMESKKLRKSSEHFPKARKVKQPNLRVTRSRNRSSQNKNVQVRNEVESECTKCSSGNGVSACPSTHSRSKQHLEQNRPSIAEVGCGKNCWKCLLVEVMETGKMEDVVCMKWEFHRRRLSLRLLNEIGKCLGNSGEVFDMHEIFWQSISMLFNRNYFGPHSLLLEFIGMESHGGVFAIERASVLYNISWFCLKNIHSRTACCEYSRIQLPSVVSWLLHAFMLSREIPLLFQKVSRLLATVYLLSTSGEPFCLPYPGETLSGSHWAAFFHQASLGTYFDHQLCANPNALKLFNSVDLKESQVNAPTENLTEVCNMLRLAPGRIDNLEKFVIDFFRQLPSITVICISSLGSDYVNLLRDVLPGHFSSPALTLLSRLNSDNEPVVMLLPSDVIPQVFDVNSRFSTLHEGGNSDTKWLCPWGCTVVDDVAPEFKQILEENYLSSSLTVDTEENRSLWWAWRRKLNDRLEKFVRDMEESWLGPWKCLLLGEPLVSTSLDSVLSTVTSALKSKFEFNANENNLRAIIGGGTSVSEIEECISQLLMHKGCITRWEFCPDTKRDRSSNHCSQAKSLFGKIFHQLLAEASYEVEAGCVSRQPIILVLDSDVQMLPWENLPVLRKSEVYRMPSVGSISALINGNIYRQERSGRTDGTFPSIDPLDAFYLLNPSGDLNRTQVEFEEWFRDQKLEGKAGTPPSVEELVLALKDHDLFIYFGHGSGTQYIPGYEIQKLENCAATLLMGCGSGSLPFKGCYNPQGVVLSYLLAGSPAIIANLWEVTDKDIDRFGKSVLTAWLQERSKSTIGCNPVNLAEEFESMSIETSAGKCSRKVSRVKKSRKCKDGSGNRPKIGSFMSQAREACTLPFLIGAAPVCYGVPTGIRKKEKGPVVA